MAIKGVPLITPFTVWDTLSNTGKIGDASNITMQVIKDGSASTLATSTVTEISSADLPGIYKVSLSSAEMIADTITLAGKSTTSGVTIIPVHLITESGLVASKTSGLNFTGDAVKATLDGEVVSISSNSDITSIKNNIDILILRVTASRASGLDYLDVAISSRAPSSQVADIPTNPVLTTDARLDYLDAPVSDAGASGIVEAVTVMLEEYFDSKGINVIINGGTSPRTDITVLPRTTTPAVNPDIDNNPLRR